MTRVIRALHTIRASGGLGRMFKNSPMRGIKTLRKNTARRIKRARKTLRKKDYVVWGKRVFSRNYYKNR